MGTCFPIFFGKAFAKYWLNSKDLSALEKFNRYFEASAYWKNMQKDLIFSLLPIWFSDENAFIRQKMAAEALTHTSRLLVPMIRQGIEEKVFTTRFPEEAAVIITGVFLTFTDTLVARLLAPERGPVSIQEFWSTLDAYVDAIERILGAPSGSLKALKVAVGWPSCEPVSADRRTQRRCSHCSESTT